jgi:Ca2+-transporting ATPase
LPPKEVEIRIQRTGRNELEKNPPTPIWKLFLNQFGDLLVQLLSVAAIVSLALQDFKSGVAILFVLIVNASIAVYQEYSASGDLEALAQLAADNCRVIRESQIATIPAAELVPGDIVLLETGDKVPADLRLIDSVDISSDEAALTGESVEVKKDATFVEQASNRDSEAVALNSKPEEKKEEAHLSSKNMVFMGCTIHDGRGRGVVVKTGMQTYILNTHWLRF